MILADEVDVLVLPNGATGYNQDCWMGLRFGLLLRYHDMVDGVAVSGGVGVCGRRGEWSVRTYIGYRGRCIECGERKGMAVIGEALGLLFVMRSGRM